MDQVITFLASFLNLAVTSKAGTAVAAVALALLVWGLQKVPFVKSFVDAHAKLATVVTLFLAVAPAVITTLSTSTSWYDAAAVAVSTFLGAMGLSSVKSNLSA